MGVGTISLATLLAFDYIDVKEQRAESQSCKSKNMRTAFTDMCAQTTLLLLLQRNRKITAKILNRERRWGWLEFVRNAWKNREREREKELRSDGH